MEIRSVEAIIRALNASDVRYLIVGGLAVNAHGFERMTKDIDLVMHLVPDNIVAGLAALAKIGYAPRVPVTPEQFADSSQRERWRSEKQMLVLQLWSDQHRRTPVDIFVFEPFDFPVEFGRSTMQTLAPGVEAPIVSLDALLQMKRAAGRPQDLVDIAALEALSPYRK